MASSHEFTDPHRMSIDVNNKASFTTINNNPSLLTSGVDNVVSSPMMRASSGMTADQSAATVTNRRSDFADYRGAGGSGSGGSGVISSFRSPKSESRAAGSGGTSAKKAPKISHHSSASTSRTGKWRHKSTDVSSSASGGRQHVSDSVRNVSDCCLSLQQNSN